MLKVCIFIMIPLCTSSSRHYTQNVKMSDSRQRFWKRSNALVHFHHGPQIADAFMHYFEWIYRSHARLRI